MTTLDQNQKEKNSGSRVMMFFNNEFLERKLDFKPKKLTIKENLSQEIKETLPEIEILEKILELDESIDELIYKYRLKIQEKLMKPNLKMECHLKTFMSSSFERSENQNRNIDNKQFNEEEKKEDDSKLKVEIEDKDNEYDDELVVVMNDSQRLEKKNSQIKQNLPSYWSFSFYGRINYDNDSDNKDNNSFRKFSYYFNKLSFIFYNNSHKILHQIDWTRPSGTAYDTDGFDIRRQINKEDDIPSKVKLIYSLNNFSQRYMIINDDLINLIGVSIDTRPKILYYIWQYIKINSLQDKDNNSLVLNNKQLFKIFKVERMDITSLPNRLISMIKPIDVIDNVLEYEFESISNPFVLVNNQQNQIIENDIAVYIDDPYYMGITHLLSNSETDSILFPKFMFSIVKDTGKSDKSNIEKFYSQIAEYDKQVNELIEKMNKQFFYYNFFSQYEKDPLLFINNFLIQQKGLMKIIKEESSIIDTRFDYSSFKFYEDFKDIIQDNVFDYLKHKRRDGDR